MIRRLVFSLLALVVLGAISAASTQAPESLKPSGGFGVIRGRITAADTGRPLRRAAVSVRPDAATSQRPLATVSTNAQGAFELRDVPAGSYLVSATRAGYIEVQYGQRAPRERGVAIEVRAGATADRIDIALPRGAVMAGRVFDELGAAYPDVLVVAMELRYQQGLRLPLPTGSATTDDLGQYRISGLQPGRYQLLVTSTETWRNDKSETFGYGATFFPGTMLPQAAQTVTLGVAEQRLDLDVALAASRTARIRGRVQRPTGEPLPGETVALNRSLRPGAVLAGGSSKRTAADGSFEFRDVPPATYSLRSGGGNVGSASATLTVNGVDVDDVVLIPRTGSTLLGTIVTDTGTAPPLPPSSVRVNLVAPFGADVLPTVRVIGADSDWSVRMTSLGGPFVFRMTGLPDTWMLDAVRLGDRDITDEPFDVPTGGHEISDLLIVLTNKVGIVSGSVVNADDKPTRDATVVVFSEDASLWTTASRFVRSTRPNVDGAFTITGLPAGRYLAVAREFLLDGEWESHEFLQRASEDAVRVTLTRGGSETVQLKLPRAQ